MTQPIAEALATAESNKIYLHYFDVVQQSKPNAVDDGIYPTYVLNTVDSAYKGFEIVPVIFIRNEVFLPKDDHYVVSSRRKSTASLASRLAELVNEISGQHFANSPREVQIDCDWTERSRDAYFTFLQELSEHFELSCTIRLHQVKYAERTGVPPVSQGTLMCYNVGDFKDMQSNSILSSSLVADYIDEHTSYPLSLDIALPLFKQSVIENTLGKHRLSTTIAPGLLRNDSLHFEQIGTQLFRVARDTSYGGFHLSEGYKIKLEDVTSQDLISSYRILNASKLQIRDLVFYHLDDSCLNDDLLIETLEEL